MSLFQWITNRDPKCEIDLEDTDREKNPHETGEHISLSPYGSIAPPRIFTIADVPFLDKPNPVNKSILIVEDEQIFAEDLKEILLSFGYHVTGIASTGERAIELVDEACPDLILMDVNLGPGMNGIEVAERLLSQVSIPIIYVTAYADSALVERAKATSPYGYILKPFDSKELHTAIEIAFFKHEKDEQLKKAYDELEERVAERTASLKRINEELQKSEEHYRSLFDGIPVGICRTSPAGQILNANLALVHMLGYPDPESLQAVDVHDIYLNPEDRKQWEAIINRDGGVRNFEVQFRTYDGSIIWVRDTGEAVRDESGRVVYYNANVEDISERKSAEEVIRRRDATLAEAQRTAHLGSWEQDLITDRIFWSDELCRMYEISPDSIRKGIPRASTVIYDRLHPDDLARYKETVAQAVNNKMPFAIEYRIRLPGGSERYIYAHGTPTLDAAGKLVRLTGTAIDTTERKRAEAGLVESEKRYRAVVEDQTEFICRFTPDGTLTFVNDAYWRYFGLNRDECIGKQHSVVLPPDDSRKMKKHIASLTRKNPVALIRHRIIMPSGEVKWQRWSDRAIFNERGTVQEYQSVGRDITDTIKAEEALQESEEHYRQLVAMSPDAILVLNDSKIMELNSAALTLFGASGPGQLIGGSFTSRVHPDSQKTFKKWMRQVTDGKKPVFPLELKIVQFNDTVLDVETSAVPITYRGRPAVQVITRDITQRKMLEDQVKNHQEILEKQVQERTIDLLRTNEQLKMEVVERKEMQDELTVASNEKDLLLREIHHRVKNNLQLIIGLIDMTKMRTQDTAISTVLTDIMAKIHTMGLIHTRLYESKRFDKINMKEQVTELVDMTSGFYSHEHCTIDFTLDCAEIYLPVDKAMPCALALNEVLSNIHKHAFKGRRSGSVEISLSRKYAMLRFVIHDNGVGIPKGFNIEQTNRLGLKLMRALVEQQLHGSLTINSENGTSVVIEIPLAQEDIDYGKSTCS